MKTARSSWASSISLASPTVWPCWSTIFSTPSSIRASACDEHHHSFHPPHCSIRPARNSALALVRRLAQNLPPPQLHDLPLHRRLVPSHRPLHFSAHLRSKNHQLHFRCVSPPEPHQI